MTGRALLISGNARFPLTSSGGAQRTLGYLVALSQHHEVTFCCPLQPELRAEAEASLAGIVSRFVWIDEADRVSLGIPRDGSRLRRFGRYFADLLTHWTPLSWRFTNDGWAQRLAPELARADVVLTRISRVSALGLPAGGSKVVADFDDLAFVVLWQLCRSLTPGFATPMFFAEMIRSWIADQIVARRVARVLCSSVGDQRKLWTSRTTLIPNGVTVQPRSAGVETNLDEVLFVGDCAWEPNSEGLRWFVQEVWPIVIAARPSARLSVVGRDATPETLPFITDARITMTANVESVVPYIERAALSIAPIRRGGGTRIKIIEALAYGIPVVATPVGAAGISDTVFPEHGLVLGASPAEFAAGVLDALEAPAAARARAERGAQKVRAEFTWEAVMRPIVEHLDEWVK